MSARVANLRQAAPVRWLRALAGLLVVVLIAVTIVFFLTRILGDPVQSLAPVGATQETLDNLRRTHGLDKPLLEQYGSFVSSLATGEFQDSIFLRRPALPLVIERIPTTLVLVAIAVALAIGMGTLTAIAAVLSRRWGKLLEKWALVAATVADFWIGLVLIALVAVKLGWTATSGYGIDLQHLLLPVLTLAILPYGRFTRVLLSSLREELGQDYAQVLRVRGVSERRIVLRHALRPALAPGATLAAYDIAQILAGGTIIVETIFGWPGIGQFAFAAVDRRDFPVVEAFALVAVIGVTLINIAVDRLNGRIDPRLRGREASA